MLKVQIHGVHHVHATTLLAPVALQLRSPLPIGVRRTILARRGEPASTSTQI
jgi:hypothetical protein